MSTHIFVEIPYNTVLKVDCDLLGLLLQCKLFHEEYSYETNTNVYKEVEPDKSRFKIHAAIDSSVIPLGDTVSIEIQDILAENNRLARENEKLLKQLNEQVKVSTELVNAIS